MKLSRDIPNFLCDLLWRHWNLDKHCEVEKEQNAK